MKYPGSSIGQKLEWTGQMISSGVSSRIYYVSMNGFDTHSLQKDLHAQLMRQFAAAVAAFSRHRERAGLSDRVVLVAFSEFGRRVRENGSQGTDHGVAGPVWVVSGGVRGGVVGEPPDLGNLVDGDLPHGIDFRRIYATLLDEVLGVGAREILGGDFEKLPFLRTRKRGVF